MAVILSCRSVVLRDRCPADIDDYVRWEAVLDWWKAWDGPDLGPHPTGEEPETRAERVRAALRAGLREPLPRIRRRFEIDGPGGAHLGWTNSYRLTQGGEGIAIGIDLPDLARGGRNVGTIAFSLHAAYRFRAEGRPILYTETWSGNLPMIGLAVRVGFEECAREIGCRHIRGRAYDSLRFALTPNRLESACPWLAEATIPSPDGNGE